MVCMCPTPAGAGHRRNAEPDGAARSSLTELRTNPTNLANRISRQDPRRTVCLSVIRNPPGAVGDVVVKNISYTISEAAHLTGLSRFTICKAIDQKALQVWRPWPGGNPRIYHDWLEQWLGRQLPRSTNHAA